MPRLKAELFASVYVSPFPYTKQTASILTAGKSLILQNHVLVRELDYGALSKMIDHFVQSDLEVITKWWKYQDPGMVFRAARALIHFAGESEISFPKWSIDMHWKIYLLYPIDLQ